MSIALTIEAAITAALSFFLWGVFRSDPATGVGTMRGTALALPVIAAPLLAGSVPLMLASTVIGVGFSVILLRGVHAPWKGGVG